jgi:hypothetical protein
MPLTCTFEEMNPREKPQKNPEQKKRKKSHSQKESRISPSLV